MAISKGTTPTVICTFNSQELDLTQANNVYVTFASNMKVFTKTGDDLIVEPNRVSVYLSQADTLGLQIEDAKIQVDWTYDNGRRGNSSIEKLIVKDNLLKREVE